MTPDLPLLSPEQALQLLDLLSSDDAFRAVFHETPAKALGAIAPDVAEACRDCSTQGPLASKEEFAQARDRLVERLTADAVFRVPHCFVSGEIDAQLRHPPAP
ncbi:NHLP-related RiPP peptide [Stenotrophomonas sp.]|uniref:NHLP-related RiPP peptide n=1 Tax=Stenotrophomonas sp. TaxID=69392 RepID=UPI00289BEF6F|nr:NHLP-related RiPP peptide [Stenotrophomonas sp.]